MTFLLGCMRQRKMMHQEINGQSTVWMRSNANRINRELIINKYV